MKTKIREQIVHRMKHAEFISKNVYPLASWGHWHYFWCSECQGPVWKISDLITGWLLGYTFGQEPVRNE